MKTAVMHQEAKVDQSHIHYHALAMIAGLAKLDRNFYEWDIEAIIEEARYIGERLSDVENIPDAILTDAQASAVRIAFHNQDFREIDALWFRVYDQARDDGQQPDAGISQEAWWD